MGSSKTTALDNLSGSQNKTKVMNVTKEMSRRVMVGRGDKDWWGKPQRNWVRVTRTLYRCAKLSRSTFQLKKKTILKRVGASQAWFASCIPWFHICSRFFPSVGSELGHLSETLFPWPVPRIFFFFFEQNFPSWQEFPPLNLLPLSLVPHTPRPPNQSETYFKLWVGFCCSSAW